MGYMTIDSNKKLWLVTGMALLVPSSGHVALGRSVRGLWLLLWMFVFGYITFQLTPETLSFTGRFAGGLVIWVLSVVEAHGLGKRQLFSHRLTYSKPVRLKGQRKIQNREAIK